MAFNYCVNLSQNNSNFYPTTESVKKQDAIKPNWENLPHKLLANIFSKLARSELLNCALTCKQWKAVSSDQSLLTLLEKKELSALHTEMMVEALGGIDAVYALPKLILDKRTNWEDIGMAGAIPLPKVTAPIMRGIFYDGTPFIAIRFYYEQNNEIHENAIILYQNKTYVHPSPYYGETVCNGILNSPLRSKAPFEFKSDFDSLAEFVRNKQVVEKHKQRGTVVEEIDLTFNISRPLPRTPDLDYEQEAWEIVKNFDF